MQFIRRLALGLLVALIVLIAGLGLSLPIDTLLNRGRVAALANEAVPRPEGPPVAAFVARPEGEGSLPAVIMIHEFWGLNEAIIGKAQALAEEGYLVVAPDTFRGSTTRWIPKAIYQTVTAPRERIDADLDAVFAWLEAQAGVDPERIAVMGFCYGGRAALHYSLHNPTVAATAVFYGSPVTDPERLRVLSGPVLGVFGSADASIPVSEVHAFERALTEAGVPHQVSLYEGEGHAFVSGMDAIRAGGAPGRAWEELLGFLAGALRAEGAP